MTLLGQKEQETLKKRFKDLKDDVQLTCFTQDFECQYCRETRSMAEEVSALSEKIHLKVLDFQKEKAVADAYGVDKIPALVVEGRKDHGIRFYGIPAGYEFMSLLEAISRVSTLDTNLSQETLDTLSKLKKPVHIQVMVTPTWPYCTQAVVTAQSMAIASDLIRADMVEVSEFVHLAQKYNVRGVPRIVINETIQFDGAYPEREFLAKIMEVV